MPGLRVEGTMGGGRWWRSPIILGLIAAIAVVGCQVPLTPRPPDSATGPPEAGSSASIAPARFQNGPGVEMVRTTAPRTAHAPASGHASGPASGQASGAHRRTPEPLADRLVASMVDHISRHHGRNDGEPVRISMRGLRNQSHATAQEFRSLQSRLAAILTVAGEAEGVEFRDDGFEPDYNLIGGAYLINDDGFDQWEIYLRICPEGEGWTAWRCNGPLRVIRHPRPGAPQILAVPD